MSIEFLPIENKNERWEKVEELTAKLMLELKLKEAIITKMQNDISTLTDEIEKLKGVK